MTSDGTLASAAGTETPLPTTQSFQLTVSVEMIAYAVLLFFVIALRVAYLSEVPMNTQEAEQALAAHHLVTPEAPGEPTAPTSPIIFWLQALFFTGIGTTEVAARLPGIVGAVVLVFMPLLFRGRIGAERSFALSLLLAISPTLIASARTSHEMIWATVAALGVLWAFWNYWQSDSLQDARWLALFLGALLLLTGPSGLLLALIMIASGAGALFWSIFTAPEDRDTPGDELLLEVQRRWQQMPWREVLSTAGGLIFVVGTGFFLVPSAFNSIVNGLTETLIGSVQAFPSGADTAITALFLHELPLIAVAGLSIGLLLTNAAPNFQERVFMLWALIGFAFLFGYRGAHPAMVAWVVIPLCFLVADFIVELTANIRPSLLFEPNRTDEVASYWWLKWLVGLVVASLLVMFAVHLAEVGRGLAAVPDGTTIFMILGEARYDMMKAAMLWVVITIIFLVMGFVVVSSLYGGPNTWQGYGLGAVIFLVFFGVGTGWNTAVEYADHPGQVWFPTATTNDVTFFEETLFEVSQRARMGFTDLPIHIVADDEIITEDGLVAWLVRDYENARFVDSEEAAQGAEVVLTPGEPDEVDLGGSYVGQTFALRQTWSRETLRSWDMLAWWIQRRIPRNVTPGEEVAVLWLRIDVYDDVPN